MVNGGIAFLKDCGDEREIGECIERILILHVKVGTCCRPLVFFGFVFVNIILRGLTSLEELKFWMTGNAVA